MDKKNFPSQQIHISSQIFESTRVSAASRVQKLVVLFFGLLLHSYPFCNLHNYIIREKISLAIQNKVVAYGPFIINITIKGKDVIPLYIYITGVCDTIDKRNSELWRLEGINT